MLLATVPAPPPAPRSFRLRVLDATTAAFMLVGAIWALVGAIAGSALLSTAGAPWTDMILDRRGVVANAHATDARAKSTRVNRQRVFEIAYSFTDSGGIARTTSTATTNRRLVAQARQGAPLTIDYDPQRPARSRIHGERASLVGIPGLLPFAIAGAGLVFAAIGFRRARRVRDIYVHGQAAVATITATKATAMRINWQRVIRVNYVFSTIGGTAEGRTTSRTPPAVGAKVWILYDENDPQRSVAAESIATLVDGVSVDENRASVSRRFRRNFPRDLAISARAFFP